MKTIVAIAIIQGIIVPHIPHIPHVPHRSSPPRTAPRPAPKPQTKPANRPTPKKAATKQASTTERPRYVYSYPWWIFWSTHPHHGEKCDPLKDEYCVEVEQP